MVLSVRASRNRAFRAVPIWRSANHRSPQCPTASAWRKRFKTATSDNEPKPLRSAHPATVRRDPSIRADAKMRRHRASALWMARCSHAASCHRWGKKCEKNAHRSSQTRSTVVDSKNRSPRSATTQSSLGYHVGTSWQNPLRPEINLKVSTE